MLRTHEFERCFNYIYRFPSKIAADNGGVSFCPAFRFSKTNEFLYLECICGVKMVCIAIGCALWYSFLLRFLSTTCAQTTTPVVVWRLVAVPQTGISWLCIACPYFTMTYFVVCTYVIVVVDMFFFSVYVVGSLATTDSENGATKRQR